MSDAVAGTLIDWGNYEESQSGSQQLYNNQLPIASYLIIIAIFLIINSLVSYTNLLVSSSQSLGLATFSSFCCALLVVLNFAAGVLSANHYSKTTQYLTQHSINTKYLRTCAST